MIYRSTGQRAQVDPPTLDALPGKPVLMKLIFQMNRILQVALLPLLKQSVIKNGGNQCRQFSFNINRFKSLGIRSFGTTAPFKNEDEDKIEQFLKEHSITVKGCDAPPILSFEDCAIPKNILSHLLSQFEKPTPIQSQVNIYH